MVLSGFESQKETIFSREKPVLFLALTEKKDNTVWQHWSLTTILHVLYHWKANTMKCWLSQGLI